jgi:hypothetical protein
MRLTNKLNIKKSMSKYFLFFLIFYLFFLRFIGISEESYSRMKHIHFVIYRLKSILLFLLLIFINSFLLFVFIQR